MHCSVYVFIAFFILVFWCFWYLVMAWPNLCNSVLKITKELLSMFWPGHILLAKLDINIPIRKK